MTSKPKWGAARIAVISLRDEITRDMAAGFPVSEIYRRHPKKLAHLTLGAFQRQVRLILKRPSLPAPTPKALSDGRKSPTGTFAHSPHIREDDRLLLLGVGDDRRK
jgi:hypothetical protein